MGAQLSWLEHSPDKTEVPSSILGTPTTFWACSSAGWNASFAMRRSRVRLPSGPFNEKRSLKLRFPSSYVPDISAYIQLLYRQVQFATSIHGVCSCTFKTEQDSNFNIKQIKSIWWMPWRKRPMKDVVGCDKPRVAVKRAMIRGFPNRVTWLGLYPVALQ